MGGQTTLYLQLVGHKSLFSGVDIPIHIFKGPRLISTLLLLKSLQLELYVVYLDVDSPIEMI